MPNITSRLCARLPEERQRSQREFIASCDLPGAHHQEVAVGAITEDVLVYCVPSHPSGGDVRVRVYGAGGAGANKERSARGVHSVELNSINERVLVDRPGVCGAPAQTLAVGLARLLDVLRGDRRERDKLDGVDLYLTGADPVAAALLDPWTLPQANRKRDVAGQDVVAQLAAELHIAEG